MATMSHTWEMAEHKITVNAYAPGIVGTAMWAVARRTLVLRRRSKEGSTREKNRNKEAINECVRTINDHGVSGRSETTRHRDKMARPALKSTNNERCSKI
ncbi:hypothetical protein PMIN06_000122 [Paraphaeosphaeria minitans]